MDSRQENSQENSQESPREVAKMEYIGFWKRVVANLIDDMILAVFIVPLLWAFYGWDYFSLDKLVYGEYGVAGVADVLIWYVLPLVWTIVFWRYKSATPGKMAISARIVDATTGGPPSTGRLIVRYFAYLVSMIPLCLGLIWVGMDKRKQGWHDKLANTVVIYDDD